jgi:hypothetical protein
LILRLARILFEWVCATIRRAPRRRERGGKLQRSRNEVYRRKTRVQFLVDYYCRIFLLALWLDFLFIVASWLLPHRRSTSCGLEIRTSCAKELLRTWQRRQSQREHLRTKNKEESEPGAHTPGWRLFRLNLARQGWVVILVVGAVRGADLSDIAMHSTLFVPRGGRLLKHDCDFVACPAQGGYFPPALAKREPRSWRNPVALHT